MTNGQIAILCDIGQSTCCPEDRKQEVEQLIAEGYVVQAGDLYELTPKAEKLLTDRGAGLNEA